MKFLYIQFLVFLIFFSLHSHSSVCTEKIEAVLKKWPKVVEWQNEWSELTQGFTKKESPTDEVGTWIGLDGSQSRAVLTKETLSETTRIIFTDSKCEVRYEHEIKKIANLTKNDFSDKNLIELLENSKKRNTSGVIYLWSPSMHVSSLGYEEIRPLTEKLKLSLSVLADPNISYPDANKFRISKGYKFPILFLKSSELIRRNMLNHFPSLIFYSNGKLRRHARFGYDSAERLEPILTQWAKE